MEETTKPASTRTRETIQFHGTPPNKSLRAESRPIPLPQSALLNVQVSQLDGDAKLSSERSLYRSIDCCLPHIAIDTTHSEALSLNGIKMTVLELRYIDQLAVKSRANRAACPDLL